MSEQQTPEVIAIDARQLGLADEPALREHLRSMSSCVPGRFASRSYRYPLALLAWHSAPVGVDVERIEACTPAFAESIRTPAERTRAVGRREDDREVMSLWSGKEALSKALGDPLAYDPRHLEGPSSWPAGRAGPWRALALELGPEHVGWLCWRAE